jgi:hypothetical protein
MKKFALLFLVLSFAGLAMAAACEEGQKESISRDQDQVDRQQAVYASAQPFPQFDFSQTRHSLTQIYQAKTRAVNTWSVISLFDKPVFVCPSVGYPIPADTQLTNPLQATRLTGEDGGVTNIEQAEPDGTYTSKNTIATFILCVRPGGQVTAVYSEPTVLVFPFEVRIVDGAIVDAGGDPSYAIEVKE